MSEARSLSRVPFVRLYQAWTMHRFAKWVTSWEQSEGYFVDEREQAAAWARKYADHLMRSRRGRTSRGKDNG